MQEPTTRVDINEVTIAGSLTRDPDPLRTTRKGQPVCNGRIMNRRPKVGFIDIAAFGDNAELLAGLEKGQVIEVSGPLDWHEWETKKGNKRQELSVIALELRVIDSEESDAGATKGAVNATKGAEELANDESIDIREVEGTGHNGRVTKEDVEDYIS